MLIALIRRALRHCAHRHGALRGLYVRLCNPGGCEYSGYLKKWGRLHAMGEHCAINPGVVFTDPAYVSLGNNVHMADCTLIGHDASVAMLYQATGARLDSVGKIIVNDNVFIGHGAIILPGVTIGPNAIVAAGAVVTRDVAPGDIVGGVPARAISTVAKLAGRLQRETELLPWARIIRERKGYFDAEVEPELVRQRVLHFFPKR